MPPKRRNEEQITEKDIKKGRKRNKFFNLQIEQLENKEELLYVLKSYELNPISIISKDDVIAVNSTNPFCFPKITFTLDWDILEMLAIVVFDRA